MTQVCSHCRCDVPSLDDKLVPCVIILSEKKPSPTSSRIRANSWSRNLKLPLTSHANMYALRVLSKHKLNSRSCCSVRITAKLYGRRVSSACWLGKVCVDGHAHAGAKFARTSKHTTWDAKISEERNFALFKWIRIVERGSWDFAVS